MINDKTILNNIIKKTNNNQISWKKTNHYNNIIFNSIDKITDNKIISISVFLSNKINLSYVEIKIPNLHLNKIITNNDNDNVYMLLLLLNYKY
jgi:hypothetical protein